MQKFFITATGTGIGKTYITNLFLKNLLMEGRQAFAIKPLVTGFQAEDSGSDTALILQTLGLEHTISNIEKISPWRFAEPISPDMAARKNNQIIALSDVVSFCNTHSGYDFLFIEGAGGIMTPVNDNETMLEFAEKLNIPVILVAGSYVGTLSHTLTALEALKKKKLQVKFMIINESDDSAVSLQDTILSLRNFCEEELIALPRLNPENHIKAMLNMLKNKNER